MKLKHAYIIMFIASGFLSITPFSAHENKIPYNLHDEADKTDIYAIPLDSSEEEEFEEEDELEEEQKHEHQKKN